MKLSRDKLAGMYRRMWLIRYFDENAKLLYQQDKIRGTTHAYIGEEARYTVGVPLASGTWY